MKIVRKPIISETFWDVKSSNIDKDLAKIIIRTMGSSLRIYLKSHSDPLLLLNPLGKFDDLTSPKGIDDDPVRNDLRLAAVPLLGGFCPFRAAASSHSAVCVDPT